MLICRATKEHYNWLLSNGWTDEYNTWDDYKGRYNALDLSNVKDKRIIFNISNTPFDKDFLGAKSMDIIELQNGKWVYIQKYENIINKHSNIKCMLN